MTLLIGLGDGISALTAGPAVQVFLETTLGTFADVSQYLRNGSIARGKSKELSRNSAGKLQLDFSNADRRFDSTYAAGPYYGTLKPMRRIVVIATNNGISYVQFAGYIDGWASRRLIPNDNVATVMATDAFKVLNRAQLATSAYDQEVITAGPYFRLRLGEPSGSTIAYSHDDLGD